MTIFLFPGQGAQHRGMGQAFAEAFPEARHTFEEANDHLGWDLTRQVFYGTDEELQQTKVCQLAIYVTGMAIARCLQEIKPVAAAGLSLGEYTALTLAGAFSFAEGLTLVKARGRWMHEVCETFPGTMAVVMGLDEKNIQDIVATLPGTLWAANFNCPGQIVLSGTRAGVEKGSELALERGAKRVIPLAVHGAFHSGLMQQAGERMAELIEATALKLPSIPVPLNVSGQPASDLPSLKKQMIQQVTHAVRWEEDVRFLMPLAKRFIEIGPGTTLSGMNRRIGVSVPTLSIETPADLETLA